MEVEGIVAGKEGESIKMTIHEDGQMPTAEEAAGEQPKELTKEEEQKQIAEFLGKVENKQNALALASQILDIMGNKWFTLPKFAKRIKVGTFEAFQKISLVKMFGHMSERTGVGMDGPEKNGQRLFKVTITNEDKIKVLQSGIEYLKSQIADYELQIKGLSS